MANQRKLGRTAAQRKALLRNQVTNLFWYGRIETTLAKAKEVRVMAERLITLAVKDDNRYRAERRTQQAGCPPPHHGVSVQHPGSAPGG